MHRRIINTIESTQLALFCKFHYIVIDDLVTDYTTIKEHLTNLLNESCDCWVTIRGELETNPVAGLRPITIDESKQRSKPSRLPTSKRKRDGRTMKAREQKTEINWLKILTAEIRFKNPLKQQRRQLY